MKEKAPFTSLWEVISQLPNLYWTFSTESPSHHCLQCLRLAANPQRRIRTSTPTHLDPRDQQHDDTPFCELSPRSYRFSMAGIPQGSESAAHAPPKNSLQRALRGWHATGAVRTVCAASSLCRVIIILCLQPYACSCGQLIAQGSHRQASFIVGPPHGRASHQQQVLMPLSPQAISTPSCSDSAYIS
jgi:hypothetical protein